MYLPITVVIVLLVCERTVPGWPQLTLPLILMIGALIGLPRLGARRFFTAAADVLSGQTFIILMLVLTAGVKSEMLSLTGARGLLATFFFAIVPAWLFYPSLLSLPFLGGFGTVFGASFILGYPYVLALLPKSSIITAAAISLFASVADFMPPTTLSGYLAAEMVGEKQYGRIFKRALIPAVIMIISGISVIVLAD